MPHSNNPDAPVRDAPPRHFSMLRTFRPADFITLANGACGMAAIFLALGVTRGDGTRVLYAAAALVLLAAVCDFCDGYVARRRGESSPFGLELDSLGDLVSFGVAPAVITYAAGAQLLADQVGLGFFVLCGLSRLARYNVGAPGLASASGKVAYFEGLPIPTSVVTLGVALLAARGEQGMAVVHVLGLGVHWPVLLFVLHGCLMASKTLRVPKP
ncbi:MAG: CDP-diacylglycerol--serine O-phosphatidyltransferase [Gammaproteobacteria bacterium]